MHTSEPVYKAEKTVFDFLPYPKNSTFEKSFMVYLDKQADVMAYTKVLPRFPIRIPYYDRDGFLKHYIPDFIVKTKDAFYIIEPKGTGFDEMASVQFKDAAAKKWCKEVSEITGNKWIYVKLVQDVFEQYKDLNFRDLVKTLHSVMQEYPKEALEELM
ncbi:MAG: hypothetical protein ACE5KE_04735 [Methanosarcinales archaeon]